MNLQLPALLAIAVGLVLASPAALAQATPVPDAGRVLQQPPPPLRPLEPSVDFVVPPPSAAAATPGGPQVTLRALRIDGATRYSEADLQAVLADALGQAFDLAGLRALAERISTHYRDHGYPFARAYLPPQSMADGSLRIEVVEGRYGEVGASGDSGLAAAAQAFLAPLRSGDVIEAAPLERATLILGDQPGVRVSPVMSPGSAAGTGDLRVEVTPSPAVAGELGLDNGGNRYTGAYRLRADVALVRLLRLGDQLQLGAQKSDGQLWLGHAAYALPLGGDGLRGLLGYTRTDYRLGREFAALDARGSARVMSAGLSYPVVRSMKSNAVLSVAAQRKRLHDEAGAAGTTDDKRVRALPLALQFDRRDAGDGGVSYGALTWTPGRLSLDAAHAAADAAGKRSAGRFDKLALDLNRLQNLPARLDLRARLAGQWTRTNLDSSEGFALGGASGVRAYPQGEASGDTGWLGQLELRYAAGAPAPYAFCDAGQVRYSARPYQPGANQRSLAGAGVGLRHGSGGWNFDAALAWRLHGGAPQSDTRDARPRLLFSASWQV